MPDGTPRAFRYTKGKRSWDHGGGVLTWVAVWWALTWLLRRCKPLAYHPVALAGIVAVIGSYALSAWFLLLLVLAVYVWAFLWPDSYLRHVNPRAESFLAGFKYRHRPRRKLEANGLLNDKDPIPTVSHVRKIGCTTRVRIKMSDGDEINYWRERSARLAQTYNALDCKINPYRREVLNPFKHEMVTKPRWLEMEFLTKDPFSSRMGAEFIDFHRGDTLQPVVAVTRSGEPQRHNLAAHRLRIAMTRWGKSNAIRAMIYAQHRNIKDGLLELWGIDGKGGVEQSLLRHVFARVAYGDKGYTEFDQLLKDAVKVMQRRQRHMRKFGFTEHIATPDHPWLLVVIDELMVLTSKTIPSTLRTSIAANIMLIHQQGIACGVTVDASTQLAQKDLFGNIERDGFTEFELGKVERGAVDMIFGSGWWQMGVRADEIPDDLKGVFYKKTDATMTPEQTRYPNIAVADVSQKALGFTVDKSAFHDLLHPKLPDLPAPALTSQAAEPEPESELQPAGRLTDL